MINIQTTSPIIGIYKITSPSGKIYIGQSTNIINRFITYEKYPCRYNSQRKLFNSIQKYGWDNHIKEILEECPESYLNELETWWKLYYNSVEDGLNCGYWDTGGGIRSEETRQRIKNKWKNKPQHEKDATNKNRSISMIKRYSKMSEDEKLVIKQRNINAWANKSDEEKKIINQKIISKRDSKRTGKINKQYWNNKTQQQREEIIKRLNQSRKGKPINQYDLENKFIKEWVNIKTASQYHNGDIQACCSGKQKTAGGYIWKYKK